MKNLEEDFNPRWDYVIDMASIGMKIQNKFRKYFYEDDINKYIVCFDNWKH